MIIQREYLRTIGHAMVDDKALADRVQDALNRFYPGHPLQVDFREDQGLVIIKHPAVSLTYGYVLFLERIYADRPLRCVMQAGGEMLERAKMPRSYWDGQFAAHVEGVLPTHQPINGLII